MYNERYGKVVETLFDKYELTLKDRVVAGHLLAYIDVGDCTIDDLKKDAAKVMNRFVSYYRGIYEKDLDIVNELLCNEYLGIMEAYCEEDKKDRLNTVIACIEEIIANT